MEYLTSFSFTLDSNNLKWKNYFDSLEKNSIGVYSVTKYFYDNLKDVLSKVFDNDSDITSLSPLSEESLSLSTESFKEWYVTYKDLLSEGEMCCIAIPGYLYKSSAQSCFSVVNNIIKTQVILTDSITISDYAQLVEDLFVLRFGKKPQDFTGSQIEYFIPAQQIVVSQAAINAGDVKENKVEAPQNPEVKENKCFCNRDITVEEMTSLIYELRDKEKYKSYKECLFIKGDECKEIRHTKDKTLKDSTEIENFTKEINKTFSTYGIYSCIRKIHMLAQCYCESNRFLATSEENGKNSYKGGIIFKGRGLIQLTHDYTYLAYYDYKNSTNYYSKYQTRTDSSQTLVDFINEKKISGFDEDFYDKKLIPFAKTVSTDLNKVIDSAGWYATKFKSSLLTKMDKGLTNTDITSVTKVINGGTNGLSERKNYTKWIKDFWKYADFHK